MLKKCKTTSIGGPPQYKKQKPVQTVVFERIFDFHTEGSTFNVEYRETPKNHR